MVDFVQSANIKSATPVADPIADVVTFSTIVPHDRATL
jgi:hypothetical protein